MKKSLHLVLTAVLMCLNLASPVLAADCNQNSIDDATDLANGSSMDCNSNSVPDECDIVSGTLTFPQQSFHYSANEIYGFADFDGDGDNDILVNSNGISVGENAGLGEFTVEHLTDFQFPGLTSVTKKDLVLGNFVNNGSGRVEGLLPLDFFGFPGPVFGGSSQYMFSLNGGSYRSRKLKVFSGLGSLELPATGNRVTSIAAGDFNSDGLSDLVINGLSASGAGLTVIAFLKTLFAIDLKRYC